MSEQPSPHRPGPVPLRSAQLSWRVPPLPRPLTSFVGREDEIETIRELLVDPNVRIVTLTGTGGVGKTRLAIKVAIETTFSFAATIFVPLASVRGPEHVLPAIARALGNNDLGTESLSERIASQIGDADALLVLDNMEHLLDAAALISQLVADCPNVKVLATSRAVLRLSGEHNVLVSPFDVPLSDSPRIADEMMSNPAVRLFADRAVSANPAFALSGENLADVVNLCRSLDGLPLAIELAAAQNRLLTPHAMLSHLVPRLEMLVDGPRDQPGRLQSMRDAISWSHDLLSAEQQVIFSQCSVFSGGFDLDAAHAVLRTTEKDGSGQDENHTLHLLGTLVDMNLLLDAPQPDGEPRFHMLETVREFASDRLTQRYDEAPVRDRHSTYFLEYAAQAEARLIIDGSAEWVHQLTLDWANLSSAVDWSLSRGNAQAVLRLAGTALSLAYARGAPGEALGWLEEAVEIGGEAPAELRVDALFTISALAQVLGDFDRAIRSADSSLALARSTENAFGEGRALLNMGITREWQGDLDAASRLYAEADARMKDVPPGRLPHWTILPRANLADIALLKGDSARAISLAEEALRQWRDDGYLWGIAQSLGTVAAAACERGDVARSARTYSEVLDTWLACEDGRGVAGTIAGIAALAAARGQLDRAAELLGAAWAYGDSLGIRFLAHHKYAEQARASIRTRLGDDQFDAAYATGLKWNRDEALARARAVIASAESAISRTPVLSPRELDVLRLLVAGHPDREIATTLNISPRTVQTHVAGLFSKLQAGSRAEVAAIAVRRGLA